ncbi:type IV secretion system protein [Roseibacillus persicicus]|uniref:type IV secretion system protein n=1 Tax=Roseibacillus persicicus TaxID=454148 RepID=UPI00398B9A91
MTPDFTQLNSLFETMQDEANQLYSAMTGIAALLILGSLIARASQAESNPAQLVRSIFAVGFVSFCIHAFPDWVNQIQFITHGWVEELDADPSQTHQKVAALLSGASEGERQLGIWDVLWSKDGGLGQAVLFAIVLLAAHIALVVMWIVAFVQQFMLLLQTALAPPFLAMFLIGALSSKAWGYLLNLVSVSLIPLGWAIMHIVTTGLMGWAEDNQVYAVESDSVVAGSMSVFFILLVSVWIVIGTIGAPWMIFKLLTNGANVGATLLSQAGLAIGGGLGGAVSAGATAHLTGGSVAAVGTAGVIGGTVGTLTGSAGGSSVMMPALVGAGASLAMPSTASSGEGVNARAQEIVTRG